MRLRLIHQLSLLLIAAVGLAVAAVGGVVLWNLRTGFSDYLRSREAQQLQRFAALVSVRAQDDPALTWLRGSREAMRSLVEDFSRAEGLPIPAGPEFQRPSRPQRPPRPEYGGGPPGRFGPGGPGPGGPDGPGGPRGPRDPDEFPGQDAPPPPNAPASLRADDAASGLPEPGPAGNPVATQGPPPGAGAPGGLTARLQIFDVQGRWVAGRAQPEGRELLRASVLSRGQVVGEVRLTMEPQLQGIDAHFLSRQYLGLGLAAGAAVLLSLLGAWWVAGHIGRPLRDVQNAAAKIARGELDTRIPEAGSHELATLIGNVNHMAESLQRLEGARRSWIAQISHELRTPLAVLRGELESIEDGARQPTPEVIGNLREEVLHLVRLVGDLHTLSMADLGALPCEFIDGDALGAMERAARRFGARAAGAGLEFGRADGPSLRVRWDFGRIEQLLDNLLENSLRYTDTPGRVRLSWQSDGQGVMLVVEDSPPGVPDHQLNLLFEPLFRADTARQRRSGGSGLGLAIVRAIVQAHHGKIVARHSPLGGLAVQVWLPVDAEAGR